MQTGIPDEWRCKHLFVLVGGNPLPNYVVAKLLLPTGGVLHLVHSPDTYEIAERIGREFPSYQLHPVQNPANPTEIAHVLKAALRECIGKRIALNYTGGTKTMAVHAHRTLHQVWQGDQLVSTYLDAQTLTLVRDDTGKSTDVQYLVQPEISQLLKLHGIQLKDDELRNCASSTAGLDLALAKAHAKPGGQLAYERWCQRYLRTLKPKAFDECHQALAQGLGEIPSLDALPREDLYDRVLLALRGSPCSDSHLAEKAKHLTVKPIPFPKAPELREVAEAMRQTLNVEGEAFDPQQVLNAPAARFRTFKTLIKYLDGFWVERLALDAFIANKIDCRLHDHGMSLQTDPNKSYNFEADVAAMQGYRLYVVSCTRSAQRGLCKSKLFEAFVRARQLGGDEARVGLVCCDKSPNVLQREATDDWRAGKERIRVFGPKQLAELPTAFADWLQR